MSYEAEIIEQHDHSHDGSFYKKIKKTTIVLTVITLIELGLGLLIYNVHKGPDPSQMMILFFKGVISILTVAKAYYIVSVFMHLGDEKRSFAMTVIVPLILFIWFIIAFLYDGNSYKNLRNKYDKHFLETTSQQHPVRPATTAPAKPERQ